ncbi:hypothetical protein BN1326_150152 [Staphylococcus argenteus]|uniref:Uncharacterized protein n=1 Tax=Staphylococcus argenteus TaxID=985002 RepID=A0A7U7PXM1_9STAP|nr:hypothetical protein BN1326_150152 [Staphylococcus argenteus]CRI18315.1 hypothetical protein BN1326_150152 [Staphylococcus argenteus]
MSFCYTIHNNGFLCINKVILALNMHFLFKTRLKSMLYKVFYTVK